MTNRYEDNLDTAKFFGPNILQTTLCLASLILLLLLSTERDYIVYRDLIWQLSLQMTLDLFESVEMVDVIIEENEFSHGVPEGFEKAMLAFVCNSFLWSLFQLFEITIR